MLLQHPGFVFAREIKAEGAGRLYGSVVGWEETAELGHSGRAGAQREVGEQPRQWESRSQGLVTAYLAAWTLESPPRRPRRNCELPAVASSSSGCSWHLGSGPVEGRSVCV